MLPVGAQPSASWDGLVGLFTQPTAETLPPGQVALTFSEVRFLQENNDVQVENIWYTGSVTAALTPHWEVAVSGRNDVVKTFLGDAVLPQSKISQAKIIGDVKYIVTPPTGNRIGLAAGVLDITDTTDTIHGEDIGRGRRFFAVGNYKWATLGLMEDNNKFGAYAGAKWDIFDNLDLIAEYSTRSPFVVISPKPANRANFNLGARFYPRSVPNLRLDAAAVGDGEFNFGFSVSYRFKL
jgi:hypothetical protein